MFRFKCATCGQWHDGMPSFATEAPVYYYSIPKDERVARCHLTSDTCTVDDEFFFIRGCVEIPVTGADEPFVWGVWVSLSKASFTEYLANWDTLERSGLGPYFGWLSVSFPVYPFADSLKTSVYPRNNGIRPLIELDETEHPLAVEQRTGISVERVAEIYAAYQHG
jgi:hypothetical protein